MKKVYNVIKTTWILRNEIIFFEDHVVVKREKMYHYAETKYLHDFAKENMLYISHDVATCFVGEFLGGESLESVLLHGYRTNQC
jgi:hypothetical protein